MIFNMVGGGGGSGATLVVSCPANVSVTVSKDDKSYTKNSGSLGSTTFKGLATGTWTVTISGNGQTATKTIGITADYAITIAFFSATINITYPANSNCVVTNSGGQTVASDTNTGSSAKTWTAIVGATGTYTVTATATDGSGKSKSQSVEITSDGQSVSVELGYRTNYYINGVEYIGMEPIKDSINTNYGTVTENADNVFIASKGYSIAVGYISSDSVDLSGVTKLFCKITGLSKNNSQNDNGLRMSVCNTKTPYHNGDRSDSAVINIGSGELNNGTYTLDVSQITSGYIGVYSYGKYLSDGTQHDVSFNLVEFYSE